MATTEHEPTFMDAIRGRDRVPTPGRLSVRHLQQRDQALASLERAQDELKRLLEIERGETTTETSPRLSEVREIIGEVGNLRHRLDRTYV